MTTVRFVSAAARVGARASGPPPADVTGGWHPDLWLGAPSSGGLTLPSAHPTAAWMYAPRGVYLGTYHGREILVAADTGNHRVMIWHDLPTADEQPCDVVVGQPDESSEGPAAGGRSTRRGMNLPTGVLVHGDTLVVADAWHHRILVYAELPSRPDVEPDLVLGQGSLDQVQPNRGGPCQATSTYWPFGVAVVAGRFYVADTGNRRVLGWSGGIPSSPDTPPDLILGQPDAGHREESRGGPAGPNSFRWPHDVAGNEQWLVVADAGDHRLLGWRGHPGEDRGADLVLGQPDFATITESPYTPQGAGTLRFPYAVDIQGDRMVVADTANNRILVWESVPVPDDHGLGRPADALIGQPDFGASGENGWTAVGPDTLCWPYGLSLHGDRLAVADSGNNRITIWSRR
ncbi:MAG: NHL repeat-containing protein [Actinomycetes bacterium]